MSYPTRCTKCGKRKSISSRTLRLCVTIKEWRFKCPTCSNKKWYLDRWRVKNELGIKPSCDCGAYHFIHRKGSGYCFYHPDAEQRDIARRS